MMVGSRRPFGAENRKKKRPGAGALVVLHIFQEATGMSHSGPRTV